MTQREFDRWSEAYFTAFPDALNWLHRCQNPAGTLAVWFKTLERCNYADMAMVTDKIICGELAPIEAFSREQTAIHLRAYVGRVADDRNRVQKQMAERRKLSDGKSQAKRLDGPGAASMFTKIIEFREEAVAKGLSDMKPSAERPSEVSIYASEKLEAWLAENSDRVAVGPNGDAYESPE